MKLISGKIRNMNALTDSRGIIAAAAMDKRDSLLRAVAKGEGVAASAVTDQRK